MSVDPTDPETFEDEDTGRRDELDAGGARGGRRGAADRPAPPAGRAPSRVASTDEADRGGPAEQARVVELDEDEYR